MCRAFFVIVTTMVDDECRESCRCTTSDAMAWGATGRRVWKSYSPETFGAWSLFVGSSLFPLVCCCAPRQVDGREIIRRWFSENLTRLRSQQCVITSSTHEIPHHCLGCRGTRHHDVVLADDCSDHCASGRGGVWRRTGRERFDGWIGSSAWIDHLVEFLELGRGLDEGRGYV